LGKDVRQLADMRRLVNHHSKSLLALDPEFSLEIAFVNNHAEDIISAKVRLDILAQLPRESEAAPKIEAVVLAVEKIRASDRTLSCGAKVQSEVDGVVGMLRSIGRGICPTSHMRCSMSEYYTQCLKRMENFCFFAAPHDTMQNILVHLRGRKALQAMFKTMQADLAKDKVHRLKELMDFCTFSWMLSAEEKKSTEEWIAKTTTQQLLANSATTAIADEGRFGTDPATQLACVPVSGAAAGHSSSSCR
jgi:hypothetical protein